MTSIVDYSSPTVTKSACLVNDGKLPTTSELLRPGVSFIRPAAQAPFNDIRRLLDHLRNTSTDAAALNAIYPTRGIFKSAATHNPTTDQKFTVDLSPKRVSLIPADLRSTLSRYGLEEVLSFFGTIVESHVPEILEALSTIAGRDLTALHAKQNLNFRLCDYAPETADPESKNGCGAHTDYGTFSIIFQDEHAGLEIEAPDAPGTWIALPSSGTVLLCGWCAVILSGDKIRAVRHRVRRTPGQRRISAVLFVAPDLDVVLTPSSQNGSVSGFSDRIMSGAVSVAWFKDIMGKKWRWREGNLVLEKDDETQVLQDHDIERLVWGNGVK